MNIVRPLLVSARPGTTLSHYPTPSPSLSLPPSNENSLNWINASVHIYAAVYVDK